jgi:glycosyltransferase 2 family protein
MDSVVGLKGDGAPRHRGNRPRALLALVGVVVSAVFMWLALRNADFDRTWEALARADIGWLALSVALMVVAFFIRAVRWSSLFEPERRPPLRPVVRATFIGYVANALLPVRAGDAAKAVALNRTARTPIAESVATILTERVYDVLSLILLLFVMAPWLPEVSWLRAAGLLAAGLLVATAVIIGVVLRFQDRPIRAVLRPFTLLPFVPDELSERAASHFVEGLAGLLKPRVAAVAFGWTTL